MKKDIVVLVAFLCIAQVVVREEVFGYSHCVCKLILHHNTRSQLPMSQLYSALLYKYNSILSYNFHLEI